MKAEDLMIGDWVFSFHAGRNIQIKELLEDSVVCSKNLRISADENIVIESYDNISPIQLTEEILEKNGFKKETHFIDWNERTLYKVGYDMYIIMNYFEGDNFTLCKIYDDSDEGAIVIDITSVNYVHELQHALRLCGIERRLCYE